MHEVMQGRGEEHILDKHPSPTRNSFEDLVGKGGDGHNGMGEACNPKAYD